MGKEKPGLGGSDPIAPESEITRLTLDIKQYEWLLRTSLGPKARKMFEHLLARARSELALMEAEESQVRAWVEQASGLC